MTATTYFTLRWFNTAPPQPRRGGTRAHRVRRAGVHALRPNGWSRPSQPCATAVA